MRWCVFHDSERGCELSVVDIIGLVKAAFTFTFSYPHPSTAVDGIGKVTVAKLWPIPELRRPPWCVNEVCGVVSMSNAIIVSARTIYSLYIL